MDNVTTEYASAYSGIPRAEFDRVPTRDPWRKAFEALLAAHEQTRRLLAEAESDADHARACVDEIYGGIFGREAREADAMAQAESVERVAKWRARRHDQARCVVYYVRINDHIKIGYTSQLPQRFATFHVYPSALLAIEPGGRDVERKRHLQFASLRDGVHERFTPTPELMDHIAQAREMFGDPAPFLAPGGHDRG